MDNSAQKTDNSQPKRRIWQWITIFAVLISLISGSFLLYQWWQNRQINTKIQEKEQTLAQLEQAEQQKAVQQYQKQQKDWKLIAILAQNPATNHFFNDLLSGYAYRFAEKQNLTNYCLPLSFGGFYQKTIQDGERQGEMGNCLYQSESQPVIISLNQVYLFNKLGHERYLTSPESYLMIDFMALIETISHELAHYFQFSKYGLSSCESSGKRDEAGKFLAPELVSEHTEFTRKIKEMIINSN